MAKALKGDAIEQMCRNYWNAYRDGFLSVGGSAEYPTWDEFSEAKAKDETRRCMRHAVEALLDLPDSVFTDDPAKKAHARMEKGSFKALHARMFPDKALRRKTFERTQAELQAEALNAGAQNG